MAVVITKAQIEIKQAEIKPCICTGFLDDVLPDVSDLLVGPVVCQCCQVFLLHCLRNVEQQILLKAFALSLTMSDKEIHQALRIFVHSL